MALWPDPENRIRQKKNKLRGDDGAGNELDNILVTVYF